MADAAIRIACTGVVVEWRGPAPFYFVELPDTVFGEIRCAARHASYGWGCIPVCAKIGATSFTTSLMPRADGYLLPVKAQVRRETVLAVGDRPDVTLLIGG